MTDSDTRYLNIILERVRVSATYKPKFGQGRGKGLTLTEFKGLYQRDPLYNWLGLDNPMMYAAHRAAGGMTSIYRQIGIGSEMVFRQVLQDTLGLTDDDVVWSYNTQSPGGNKRKLTLDARVPLDCINDQAAKARFQNWVKRSADLLGVDSNVSDSLRGAVFEVRQGYKSKDSKRQNADIANAKAAYANCYLPCAAILSNQIDESVQSRYQAEKWAVITGVVGKNNPLISTYDFMRDVVGYDLAGFFERNAEALREEVHTILGTLLAMEGQ